MRIATALFTYHRSEHTRQVIDALSRNTEIPEKLFIFQDGIRAETNVDEWERVGEVIKNITWCKTELHISDKSKGCARSVIDGINYVLQNYEAIIVLEDDCVPEPRFISYMYQALQKYKNRPEVYSIGGHAWDVSFSEEHIDAYFNGRTNSWGWGTWKDRWKQFQEDYLLIRRIEETEEGRRRLDIWGKDLKSMVVGNINGNCDAWDVFWSLTVIANNGVCLSPYRSLIHNIGMDGSGTHCTVRQDTWKKSVQNYNKEFIFPDEIIINKKCEQEFSNMFSGIFGVEKFKRYQNVLIDWISIKQKQKRLDLDIVKGPIAIWGKGKICDVLLQELKDIIDIMCIIESYPSMVEYQGISILGIEELPDEVKTIIVIPFFDMNQILYKVKKMKKNVILIGIDRIINSM